MLIPKELVVQAKEKMGEKAAQIIADYYSLDKWNEKNLKGCCPKHQEDTPSFVWMPKTNNFHCYGCGVSIDIVDLYMEQGMSYGVACEKLFDETGIKFRFSERGIRTKKEYKYPHPENGDDFDKIIEYLAKRKISKQTAEACGLTSDGKGNIVFNYYNTDDVLTMVKYRPARKVQRGENKNWCQQNADTSPILFNMNRIDVTKPLLICEGEVDCLSAIESGFQNAVSVPLGAGNEHWVQENWSWLEQFDKIIIWSDNDPSGEKMRKNIIPRLGAWRCYVVDAPTKGEYNGKEIPLKDINEILCVLGKEAVFSCIENANEVPIMNVVDFSDVEDFDLEQADGIYTGIEDLDCQIAKMFYGTFNIFTGVNGSGKSSFVNQVFISETLHQGQDVFVYSGELPNWQLRNWILFNLAGRRHVITTKKQGQPDMYKVKPEIKKEISDTYRGRLYFYDNELCRTSNALIEKMEEMARKRGTKVFIIDNLTVVDLESNENNKYDKQKEFIVRLIQFAKKFNVLVCLVIHPHKLESVRRMNKMEIAGSMSLSDLAHRVFAVHRVTAKEKEGTKNKRGDWIDEPIEFDVIIDILKDRLIGGQDIGIGMFYDPASRRFWTTEKELDKQFSWDKSQSNVKLPPPRIHDDPKFLQPD